MEFFHPAVYYNQNLVEPDWHNHLKNDVDETNLYSTLMQETTTHEKIIDKIKKGTSFALFGPACDCYFQDGDKVSYADLWIALKIMYNLGERPPNKTISQLCPDAFEGMFSHRFERHKWRAKKLQKQN